MFYWLFLFFLAFNSYEVNQRPTRAQAQVERVVSGSFLEDTPPRPTGNKPTRGKVNIKNCNLGPC